MRTLIFLAVVAAANAAGLDSGWDTGCTNTLKTSITKEAANNVRCNFAKDETNIYTAIPGTGLVTTPFELTSTSWSVVTDHTWVRDHESHDIANFTISTTDYLAITQPTDGFIRIFDTEGNPIQSIGAPPALATSGVNYAASNNYFDGQSTGRAPEFKPTGIAYMDGKLYVTNGFAEDRGQFMMVLTKPTGAPWEWDTVAWGGHGPGTSRFDEPRGVTFWNDKLLVADKDNKRLSHFTATGTYSDPSIGVPSTAFVTNAEANVQDGSGMLWVSSAYDSATDDQPYYIIDTTTTPHDVSTHVITDAGEAERSYIHAFPHKYGSPATQYTLISGLDAGGFGCLKNAPLIGDDDLP